jgi:uncharacterized membrane protein (GlpM family)
MSIEALLLIKVIVAVGMVLAMSYVAEAVSSKWAGIIGGLPTGSAISLYFFAYENGIEFASESALYNMIGLIAMQAFIFGYYSSSKLSAKPGIFISTLLGLILYIFTTALLSYFTVTPLIQ